MLQQRCGFLRKRRFICQCSLARNSLTREREKGGDRRGQKDKGNKRQGRENVREIRSRKGGREEGRVNFVGIIFECQDAI